MNGSVTSEAEPAPSDYFRQVLQKIIDEGAGVITSQICDLDRINEIGALADAGDNFSARKRPVLLGALRGAAAGGVACFCCDEVMPPGAPPIVVLVHASRQDFETATTLGVCPNCARKPDLRGRLNAEFPKLFTNFRPIDVLHEGGRA